MAEDKRRKEEAAEREMAAALERERREAIKRAEERKAIAIREKVLFY